MKGGGTRSRPDAVTGAIVPGVLTAAATSVSELMPYLVVMGAGFLVGAWGQLARVTVAVLAGLLLILIAVVAFIIDNSSGSSGVPGF